MKGQKSLLTVLEANDLQIFNIKLFFFLVNINKKGQSVHMMSKSLINGQAESRNLLDGTQNCYKASLFNAQLGRIISGANQNLEI